MIRAANRWCRVSISDLERHQLALLRAELGLDPPPANTKDRKTNQRKDLAAWSAATHLQDAQDLTVNRSVSCESRSLVGAGSIFIPLVPDSPRALPP
jgi:hypothetical protein